MKLYAERPLRACLQVASDLLALAWAVLWIGAALSLRERVMAMERPGTLMASAGEGVTEHMNSAAENVERVPLAGEALSTPFTRMGETGSTLSEAGASFQDAVAELALHLPLLTAALPLMLLAATWLPVRARWVRQARGVRHMRAALSPDARDRLLALRALTSAPPSQLTGVHDDPAGAWRAEDPGATRALASLELRRLGLRGT